MRRSRSSLAACMAHIYIITTQVKWYITRTCWSVQTWNTTDAKPVWYRSRSDHCACPADISHVPRGVTSETLAHRCPLPPQHKAFKLSFLLESFKLWPNYPRCLSLFASFCLTWVCVAEGMWPYCGQLPGVKTPRTQHMWENKNIHFNGPVMSSQRA